MQHEISRKLQHRQYHVKKFTFNKLITYTWHKINQGRKTRFWKKYLLNHTIIYHWQINMFDFYFFMILVFHVSRSVSQFICCLSMQDRVLEMAYRINDWLLMLHVQEILGLIFNRQMCIYRWHEKYQGSGSNDKKLY